MTIPIDRTGQRYGSLVCLRMLIERTKSGHIQWECICDCGNLAIVTSGDLSSGHTKSCGCATYIGEGKGEISQDILKSLFSYDKKTGNFIRIKSVAPNANNGDVAGSINSCGYIGIVVNRKLYLAHRLVFLYLFGYMPENGIDHINRDRKDNRISNLREVSHSCNMKNAGMLKNNKSGITGVYFCNNKNKWIAQIKINKKNIVLGRHKSFNDAVVSRFKAEQDYGFINCNSKGTPAQNYLKTNLPELI